MLLRATDPQQILGKFPLDTVHPDYHPMVQAHCERLLKDGGPVPLCEQKWVRLDGSAVDVEVASSAYWDVDGFAIQVIARDITERKEATARFRTLVEQIPAITYISTYGPNIRDIQTIMKVPRSRPHPDSPSRNGMRAQTSGCSSYIPRIRRGC